MKDSKHLDWIYERLVHVHKENELYNYMHKFRKIINKMKAQESDFEDYLNKIKEFKNK